MVEDAVSGAGLMEILSPSRASPGQKQGCRGAVLAGVQVLAI